MKSKLKKVFAGAALSVACIFPATAQEQAAVVETPAAEAVAALATSSDTPLMYAALRGELNEVKTLIAGGADVNAKDNHGTTALVWAIHRGNTDVVKELLASGAATEVTDDYYHNTPLMQAAGYGNLAMVKALLDKGAKIDARNDYNSTALLIATAANQADVVQELLDRGADASIKGQVCGLPLVCAQDKGYKSVETLLKAAKPKP